MSKKLSRYLEDIERTEKKLAELQEHLEAVRQLQKADEDTEIVRAIRSMGMDGWELMKLLDGIQNGSVELQAIRTAGSPVGGGCLDTQGNGSQEVTGGSGPDGDVQLQDGAPEGGDHGYEDE